MRIPPFDSIALLYNWEAEPTPAFLGTTFVFRHRGFFLTARHCVGTLAPSHIRIVLPLSTDPDLSVQRIEHHPTADVSLLYAASVPPESLEPFHGVGERWEWGDQIHAVGYPEESEKGGVVPTARLLTGYVQRVFTHVSTLGFRYVAGESSFGSPAGMSGGPVYLSTDLSRVIGIMCDNHDSTTYLRSVEEVQENGEVYKAHAHEVIRYGIFASLGTLVSWLDPLTI